MCKNIIIIIIKNIKQKKIPNTNKKGTSKCKLENLRHIVVVHIPKKVAESEEEKCVEMSIHSGIQTGPGLTVVLLD